VPITNQLGLPEAIVRAVSNDPYTYGSAHISATTLYGSPRPRILRKRFAEQVTEDVSDRLWALVGQIGHGILERAVHKRNAHEVLEAVRLILSDAGVPPARQLSLIQELVDSYFAEAEHGDIIERRLYGEWLGWTVSGQLDLFRGQLLEIQDYKFTSVWTYIYGGRPEWEKQLNIYAALGRRNGIHPDALKIIVIFRDWRKGDALANQDYPQRQVMVIPIPMWTPEEAERYVEERVRVHQQAELMWGEDLPECTDDERWIRGGNWVVLKEGASKAAAVSGIDSEDDALRFISEKVAKAAEMKGKAGEKAREAAAGLYPAYRPGVPIRCADYCNVAHLCSQWQRDKPVEVLLGEPTAVTTH
jgi:hypothetical protein